MRYLNLFFPHFRLQSYCKMNSDSNSNIETLDSMIQKHEELSQQLHTLEEEEKFLRRNKLQLVKLRDQQKAEVIQAIDKEQTSLLTENNVLVAQLSELESQVNCLKQQIGRNCDRYNALVDIKTSIDKRGK
jgi:DNA integrity scanning protein DisA with diadenylate cyclase activity